MPKETPEMVALIKDAIDYKLHDVNTAIPATVLSFNGAKQTVDVQPSIKVEFKDGTSEALPTVTGVPVQFPRCAKGGLKFPLATGDQVLLVFSQRSLDVWKSKGGLVAPQEGRKFNLSDAVAIPGVFSPKSADATWPGADAELKWGTAKIVLKDNGKFKVEAGSNELFAIISELIAQIKLITVTVSGVATPINNATAFDPIKAKIDTMKG